MIEPNHSTNHILRVISYPKIFTPEECQKIIDLSGLDLGDPVYIEDKNIIHNPNLYPNVKDIKINEDVSWVLKKIDKVVQHANKNFFDFDIKGINTLRLNKYENNRSFEWHTDIGNGELSIRKLTIVTFLSKREDFDGGELKWYAVNDNINQQQGSVALFPPYMMHSVSPTSRGTRYTLVCWAIGNHFK